MSKLNKSEIVKLINKCVFSLSMVMSTLYHNKTFVVISNGNRVETSFKTKRGAEGYVKKQKNKSWYDEMTFEMWSPGDGLEIVEILKSDLADINDKKIWYNNIKENVGYIINHNNYYRYENLIKEYCNNEVIEFVNIMLTALKEERGFTIIDACETVEIAEEVQEEVKEVAAIEEVKPVATTEEIRVELNNDKNGIEIYFSSKPSAEIRSELKVNGFRWSKNNGCWYSKQSEKTINFANGLLPVKEVSDNTEIAKTQEITNNNIIESVEVKEVYNNDINIDDIETYIIDTKLSERENSVSMFRTKSRDHTKEIQSILLNANRKVIELINNEYCTREIEFEAKRCLQSFKKKYFNLYVRMLRHRADNPSWAVTGRSGINVRRYNKKADVYNNMIQKSRHFMDEFNNRISKYKSIINKISKKQRQKMIEEQKNSIIVPKIEKIKIKINMGATRKIYNNASSQVIAYRIKDNTDYVIIKNWGAWRIYDNSGNEINKDITLQEAKRLLTCIANNKLDNIS